MRKYSPNTLLSFLSIFLTFLSFFCVTYLTPMQCDDFWYVRIGLRLKEHLHHYLTWSGRVVADYFSCAILQIPSHAVISAIISLFATGICYLIAKIPTVVDPEIKTYWWKYIVIAALYWVANPQIEESTFWVVGACNYVITTFFVLLFLYFLLKNNFSWWMVILSLIAGCSNENTCLAMIYMMFVLFLISRFEKLNFNSLDIKLNKKFFLICFALFTVGALILLLAPGNFQRVQSETYRNWCELSIFDKLTEFVNRSRRSLEPTSIAWYFYALLFIGVTVLLRKDQKEIAFSWKRNQRELAWSLLFFSTAIVSLIVLVASPYYPDRVLNPTLCFLLLASSFLLNPNMIQHKFLKGILVAATGWILWLFVKFFVILYANHQLIMVQNAIRIDHIKYARERRGERITVDIPQYHISQILRRHRISFMFEYIPYGLEATWNGVDELNHIPVKFDYAVLRTGKTIPVDEQSDLKNVKIYFQPKSLAVPQSTVIVESSTPINDDLFVQYTDEKTKETREIKLEEQSIELQGKYYRGITAEEDLNLSEALLKISDPKLPANSKKRFSQADVE